VSWEAWFWSTTFLLEHLLPIFFFYIMIYYLLLLYVFFFVFFGPLIPKAITPIRIPITNCSHLLLPKNQTLLSMKPIHKRFQIDWMTLSLNTNSNSAWIIAKIDAFRINFSWKIQTEIWTYRTTETKHEQTVRAANWKQNPHRLDAHSKQTLLRVPNKTNTNSALNNINLFWSDPF
jgi:hypothetical protein